MKKSISSGLRIRYLTQAINVFYAKVIETDGLPFDLRPSETLELLAHPKFKVHLERMKKGEVSYRDADDNH